MGNRLSILIFIRFNNKLYNTIINLFGCRSIVTNNLQTFKKKKNFTMKSSFIIYIDTYLTLFIRIENNCFIEQN